jgi:hypothetical protein
MSLSFGWFAVCLFFIQELQKIKKDLQALRHPGKIFREHFVLSNDVRVIDFKQVFPQVVGADKIQKAV